MFRCGKLECIWCSETFKEHEEFMDPLECQQIYCKDCKHCFGSTALRGSYDWFPDDEDCVNHQSIFNEFVASRYYHISSLSGLYTGPMH